MTLSSSRRSLRTSGSCFWICLVTSRSTQARRKRTPGPNPVSNSSGRTIRTDFGSFGSEKVTNVGSRWYGTADCPFRSGTVRSPSHFADPKERRHEAPENGTVHSRPLPPHESNHVPTLAKVDENGFAFASAAYEAAFDRSPPSLAVVLDRRLDHARSRLWAPRRVDLDGQAVAVAVDRPARTPRRRRTRPPRAPGIRAGSPPPVLACTDRNERTGARTRAAECLRSEKRLPPTAPTYQLFKTSENGQSRPNRRSVAAGMASHFIERHP